MRAVIARLASARVSIRRKSLTGLTAFHHSMTRVAAGASGFLIFTQSDERPDR